MDAPLDRRTFVRSAVAAAAAATVTLPGTPAAGAEGSGQPADPARPFHLNYSPNLGQFRAHCGDNPAEQIRFMHAHGFRGLEDNGMLKRPREQQDLIASELKRLGMTQGVFVAFADFANPVFSAHRLPGEKQADKDKVRAFLEGRMKETVELARRVGARWVTVVPGTLDLSLDFGYQTANVIEHLKFCTTFLEGTDTAMVLEPLNPLNHPGCFLTKAAQAYQICRAVGSPHCKILFDCYHQQITEGNLIHNLSAAWDEIAYLQVGDVPGRKEPTTGEINYRNVFRWLYEKGYRGVVGMEHGIQGPDKAGELRLIEAYREADNFPTA